MVKVPFKVSARTARLIGRENVATPKGAVIELVKMDMMQIVDIASYTLITSILFFMNYYQLNNI